MKTKNKVTTTLIVGFLLFFATVGTSFYITKNKANNESVEVAADTQPEDTIGDSDLVAAKVNPYATTRVLDSVTAKGLLEQETEASIDEEVELFEEFNDEELNEEVEVDSMELVEEVALDSVEAMITSTLSLAELDVEFNKVLPKVNEFLNIRSEAKQDAEVVGKLYKNSYAEVVDKGEEWTKIKSGLVEGYVNNEYLYFDDEAVTIAKSLDAFKAEVTAGSVNVRTKPTTDSEILSKASKGDTYTHVPEMDRDGWTAIMYNEEGTLAYISNEFIETKFSLKTAVSKAEEEKAAKEAEIAKSLQEAKKHKPKTTNREPITVSDDDIFLLATVVAMEAGGESYEGQLAVANVVINRMLDGYWGKTIKSVVYAPGQFSGANSGRIEQYSKRVTESNKRAAIEALAGNNNIGNYMYFIMKSRANYSSYKKYYVLGCHCFYAR